MMTVQTAQSILYDAPMLTQARQDAVDRMLLLAERVLSLDKLLADPEIVPQTKDSLVTGAMISLAAVQEYLGVE